MAILIADVSDFQRPIDPAAYKSVGITGIITKITESNNFATKTHTHNLHAAHDAGMFIAGYHFLHYRDAGQADWYLDHVERAWGCHDGMAHMLDVEQEAGGKNPDIQDVRAFANRFYERTNNHKLLIYSGGWYWRGFIGNPQDTCNAGLVDAYYVSGGGDPREIVKKVTMGWWKPYGAWKGPLIRQFTSSAHIPGEPFPVDVNVLYGSPNELEGYRRHAGPSEPWTRRPVLREGAGLLPGPANSDVAVLQRALNDIRARSPFVVDGRFGPNTSQAVRDFQEFLHSKDQSIVVDGVVGPQTWRGLYFFAALAGHPLP